MPHPNCWVSATSGDLPATSESSAARRYFCETFASFIESSNHIAINPYVLLIPVILLIQILLTLGITFWASATNVFWRDARFVVPLALQIWFYASPIVYPIHLVPQKLYPFYILNPMVGIVEGYRATVLRAMPPDWNTLGIAGLAAIVLFVSGYAYFKHVETQFADMV